MVAEIGTSAPLDTWASTGTTTDPGLSKIAQGWTLGERPPFEYMNWLQNAFGQKINHTLTWGVARWISTTEYSEGAAVGHDGSLWIALNDNDNSEPSGGNVDWARVPVASEIPTQDQTTWNAGTDTTESLISPAKLAATVTEQTGLTGAVMPFAMNSAPGGWLECDGSAVSRTTYAALFALIGTTFGAGDGSTTFNVPDMRAEFVRGWDNGRGVDSGRVFGSAQADDFEAHTHYAENTAGTDGTPDTGITLGEFTASGDGNAAAITTSTGGTETRPRNVALLYCIKT